MKRWFTIGVATLFTLVVALLVTAQEMGVWVRPVGANITNVVNVGSVNNTNCNGTNCIINPTQINGTGPVDVIVGNVTLKMNTTHFRVDVGNGSFVIR